MRELEKSSVLVIGSTSIKVVHCWSSPFKHERHAVLPNLVWLELGITGALKCIRVGAMGTHHIMKTGTPRLEAASGLCIIAATNQTHEFRHGVAVVPWWAEGVFGHEPTGREDDKVSDSSAHMVGRASENGKNGGIGMIVRYCSNGVESPQVVLVRVVVAMPSDDVKRGVVLTCCKESIVEFAVQFVFRGLFLVVKERHRGLEVTSISQTIGSDRTQLGELVVALVKLADVASYRTSGQRDTVTVYPCQQFGLTQRKRK